MGIDQQARKSWSNATARKSVHSGSVAISSTITVSLRKAAVPHEPADGPIATPSIARLYGSGRFGAAP